jgi:hypothetical protein
MRAKRFFLSGLGCLLAIGGTRAADIPLKAQPIEYVKVCSRYGEGFFYVPGTDTCLKVGGFVQYNQFFNQNGSNLPPTSSVAGLNTRSSASDYTTSSRGGASFDARTQTEYGTLRSYYSGAFILPTGLTNQYANGTYETYRAFIQFGGWTFGRSQSFFDIYASQWSIGGGFLAAGSITGVFGQNLAAYTAQFGNGFSASVSFEDANTRRSAVWDATAAVAIAGVSPAGDPYVIGASAIGPMGPATNGYTACGAAGLLDNNTNGNATTSNGLNLVGCGWGDYAAAQVPDLVGNFQVQQAWGSAQISGALHEVRANYYGNNFVAASPGFIGIAPADKWGGAIAAGISFNLPWNAGDKFWAEATYALGAVSYVGFSVNNGFVSSYARFDGAFLAQGVTFDGAFACNGGTLGSTTTAATCNRTGLQLSTSWSATAAIEHYWTPALRTSFFASYAFWTPGNSGNMLMCASPLAPIRTVAGNAAPTGAAALPGCNFDFASWGFGSRTTWQVHKDLFVAPEVIYQQIKQNMDPGQIRWAYGGGGTRASGLYVPANEGAWAGMVRITRRFFFL